MEAFEKSIMKKESYYFKGDIIVKKEDALFHWAVTQGQLFHVISTIKVADHILIYRPFKNYILFLHNFLKFCLQIK